MHKDRYFPFSFLLDLGSHTGTPTWGFVGSGATDSRNYQLLEVLAFQGIDVLGDPADIVEHVALLIETEDRHRLDWGDKDGSWMDSDYMLLHYQLAVESAKIPSLQLELGCLLLQRLPLDEYPLCEHLYVDQERTPWNPDTSLHDRVNSGAPVTDEETKKALATIALQAYVNAWTWYYCSDPDPGNPSGFPQSLTALDGIRVCYEVLEDRDHLWEIVRGLRIYLDEAWG